MPTDALRSSPLFRDLSDDQLGRIVEIGVRRSCARDEILLRAGQPNDSIFFITSGQVRVEHDSVESQHELATLEAGVSFGEMSAIERSRVGATVRAIEATELLELQREPLERLLDEHPALASTFWRNVARELTRRLARTNELVEHYVDLNEVLTASPEYAGLLGGT